MAASMMADVESVAVQVSSKSSNSTPGSGGLSTGDCASKNSTSNCIALQYSRCREAASGATQAGCQHHQPAHQAAKPPFQDVSSTGTSTA
jgi:hypothetical protein